MLERSFSSNSNLLDTLVVPFLYYALHRAHTISGIYEIQLNPQKEGFMQRKKKRSIIFELHSIPIKLERIKSRLSSNQSLCKRLYLVSYSIPLSCMVVLLLTGIFAINPSLMLKTSAVTIQDEWVVKKNNSSSDSSTNVEDKNNNNSNSGITEGADPIDDSFGGFGGDEVELSQDDVDTGIAPMSLNPNPTISLTLGKTTVETSTVQGGNTAYASNTVTLTGSYVKDYTLSIKAGSANLTIPNGANSATSTISGVGSGTVGSSMSANKWGYAVAETSNTNYAGLTYKTTPTNATTILSGAGNTESSTSMNVSKQLVFAAKFGDEATPGKYSASITLSVTATPKALTMSNITDMQDMTPEICANSSTGQTASLKDTRDNTSYNIVKYAGRCWMQQNLRLKGATNSVDPQNQGYLTPADSDVTGRWQLPATLNGSGTSVSGWTNNKDKPYSAYFNDTTRGVYYNWTAAIAMSDSSSKTSGDVDTSICPKGWKLPTNSEYSSMLSSEGIGDNSSGSTKIRGTPYSFVYAGYVRDAGTLLNSTASGSYWSRTVSSSYYANHLYFGSDRVVIAADSRDFGYPVRCVAAP